VRVLVACEFSGVVRDAFRAKGHDAWSCDILPTESPGQHIQGDVLEVLSDGWDIMIAHPPCTYLSKAGARWLYPVAGQLDEERLRVGMEARRFFMELLNADIPKVAVENPAPMNVFNLPPASHHIEPHEFGHPYSKKTLLWLRELPPLMPTAPMGAYEPFTPANTGFGKRKGQRSSRGPAKTAKQASVTFQGVAEAMADQWGGA
jgi:hypothetical protein